MLDRTTAFGLDFLFPAGDVVIGRTLADHGEFAKPMSDFLIEHAEEPSGTLVDVGANIGAICLPFAAARPAWRVIGVEPNRRLSGILATNATVNRLLNVEVAQAACGAETGVIPFANPPLDLQGNMGTMAVGRLGDAEPAPTLMIRLDEIAPADTRLVKIDAEGLDAEVLRGAPRLMSDIRPIWVVEAAVNHPQTSRAVIQTLLDADYDVFWFFVTFASFKNLKNRRPVEPGRGDANVIAVPKGRRLTWSLPVVRSADDARPGDAGAYSYLSRYGLFPVKGGAAS